MSQQRTLTNELPYVMAAVDGHLTELTGRRIGVTMFVFEFDQPEGDGTHVNYISNAKREDMIATVKAWLARMESGMTSDPPGPLARG